MKLLDLSGQKFGRLTVIKRIANDDCGRVKWACECICGKKAFVVAAKLRSGYTKSCGCIKADRMRKFASSRVRVDLSCAVSGCERRANGKYCGTHQARLYRYGSLDIKRRPNGSGNINKHGYVDVSINGRRTYEHILVAEKALGKRLPSGAVVHHVNEKRADNRPQNLVICPNEDYHRLLHKRMKEKLHGI